MPQDGGAALPAAAGAACVWVLAADRCESYAGDSGALPPTAAAECDLMLGVTDAGL